MTGRDYALAFLHAEESVPSRTMLQKLVYLAAVERDDVGSFRPYFYGPYSAELQADVESLVLDGLVNERARRLEPWESSPFEPMRYTYRLTEEGRRAAELLPDELRHRAAEIVAEARSVRAMNPAALSMAAKLRHLQSVNPAVHESDVPTLASRLGWRMTLADARRGARLLERLGSR